MGSAFTFPGQGSQKIGMGKALADAFGSAREVFEEVNDALELSLSDIMWTGEEEELRLTQNAQPALLATSLAVVYVLEREFGISLKGKIAYVAGHSLGEYSALCAAGVFSLGDAARLVRTRGLTMQKAVGVGEGAMAAILGLDMDVVVEIAEAAAHGEVCQIANDNSPGQIVVSGAASAIGRAVDIAKEKGARMAVLLPVSAPFHCDMMQPAATVMQAELERIDLSPASVPLVANVLATEIFQPHEIKARLVEQVTGMVRWRESVVFMADNGIKTLYEIGAGKVLTGLAKRIDRSLAGITVGVPEEVEALAKAL
jgi:[acyl-carrier-protein] S-malonyltransferase